MALERMIVSLAVLAPLVVSLAVRTLPSSQFTPPKWTPPGARSPLRQIWSFDTKG